MKPVTEPAWNTWKSGLADILSRVGLRCRKTKSMISHMGEKMLGETDGIPVGRRVTMCESKLRTSVLFGGGKRECFTQSGVANEARWSSPM